MAYSHDPFGLSESLEVAPAFARDELVDPPSPGVPVSDIGRVTLGIGAPSEDLRGDDEVAETGEVWGDGALDVWGKVDWGFLSKL